MDALSTLSSPYVWIATAITIFYLLYRNATASFSFFSDQGIPGPKPLPFVGNMWGLWKIDMSQNDIELVKKYGKVFGVFDGPTPNLWVADADMIKAIFVKDFDHFTDRRPFPLQTKGARKWVSILKGQEWKNVRSSVTPAFTSGKIKKMSSLIMDCVNKMVDGFQDIARNKGKFDAKEGFNAFSLDVIARCAFGLTIDNLGADDDPFVQNAKTIFHPEGSQSPMIMLPNIYPKLFSLVLDRLFVTKHLRFFLDTLDNLITERSQMKQKFNDFVDMAMESIGDFTTKEGKPMWSKEEVKELVVGQASVFMLAGFDTTASTMTTICYLLARHPEVQEKLYETVMAKQQNYDEVCQEMVLDIPYLEQVINEALRVYPPGVRIDRTCTKDYTYNNIRIPKGMIVTVPIFAMHYQEDYYSNPEKFDPDRWLPENKAQRNPYAYMPFGMGPRICIGMRFAMVEMMLALCTLVKKFRFFPIKETPEKLEFEKGFQLVLQPTHAPVGIELREHN